MSESAVQATPHPAGFSYLPHVDGLRAVAVLLVLVFHFQLIPAGEAGFIGVDIFFVISGYLITSIVRRQLDAGTFSLSAFYLARIRRLAPALTVVLFLTLAYGAARLPPLEFAEMGKQVASAQFYVSNIYYWRNFNYFGLGADSVFLLHTWSLAVEEQFYLLFPLFLLLLHRWARPWFWPALGLVALASFGLNIAWVQAKAMSAFYLLPTRAWELLVGALLSARVAGPLGRRASEGLGVLAAVAIAVAVFSYRKGVPVPGWFALFPVLAACGLIVAGSQSATFTARFLSSAPVVYVGRISYVLYLVHWPIHVFALGELGEGYGLSWRLAMFLASVGLAALVSGVVEERVRKRLWLPSSRSMVQGYGGMLLATAAACAAVVLTAGLPSRLPARAAQLEAFTQDKSPPLTDCEYARGWHLPPPNTCHIGRPDVAPHWVVFGDSHAWAAHAAFDAWLRQRGESAWFVFRHGCLPLKGIHVVADGTNACATFNQTVYDWIEKSADLNHVVVVSTWLQAKEGIVGLTPGLGVDRKRSLQVFDQQFDETLKSLKRHGKQVDIWGPVPGAKANVPKALAMAAWRGTEADLEFTQAEHREQFGFFYAAVQRNAGLIDHLISPADALCASGRCQVVQNQTPLYADNAHVTASPAAFWARVIDVAKPPVAAH